MFWRQPLGAAPPEVGGADLSADLLSAGEMFQAWLQEGTGWGQGATLRGGVCLQMASQEDRPPGGQQRT